MNRSSMRAPRSEIEPVSEGVATGTRGLAARAASRVGFSGAMVVEPPAMAGA